MKREEIELWDLNMEYKKAICDIVKDKAMQHYRTIPKNPNQIDALLNTPFLLCIKHKIEKLILVNTEREMIVKLNRNEVLNLYYSMELI